MDTETLVAQLTSGDVQQIRAAWCAIINAGQNEEKMKPLIPFIEQIRSKTANLNLGGALAPNSRFPEYAIKTIEYHRDMPGCTCELFSGSYECFDPHNEEVNKTIEIVSEVMGNWERDFVVTCKKCRSEYDVMERNGHYTWWKWTKRTS